MELFTETPVITVRIYACRFRRFTRLLRHQCSLTCPADNSGNQLCNSEKTRSNLVIINKELKLRCDNSGSRIDLRSDAAAAVATTADHKSSLTQLCLAAQR
ncbi:hypothetical protein RHSP_82739 [Rhizobium freirei PRF 81]|uniref:Uncharacterized protein n=1 Tax=Rhizobium freirei PRF 81 TaxID=363754 RepID=N6UY28_9HYPH|nr:hypothetical protein RHSP_82739 [Rhizobium freirei PRF 81]